MHTERALSRAVRLTGVPLLGLVVVAGCFRSSHNAGSQGTSGDAQPAQTSGTTQTSATATGMRFSDANREYSLDTLKTATVTIGAHTFRVWVAQEFDPQRPHAISEGLMHVPEDEIADDQGMLFVFTDERVRSFWMLNTITPLDIAYARADGTIVKTWQMPPLTLRTFSSIEPAMFALEVKQGTFDRLGIREDQRMDIPAEVLVATDE